jgi:hypothetical protein
MENTNFFDEKYVLILKVRVDPIDAENQLVVQGDV